MHLYFLFFGDARYLPLLHRAVATLRATGCVLPWAVLTDEASAGALPADYPARIVHPHPWQRLIRRGNPGEAFDRKSTYLLALMQEAHPGPFAVLDCDNIITADPTAALLAAGATGRMAMAECPHDPPIPVPRGWPGESPTLPERTSALLVFPAEARPHAGLYAQWFARSVEPAHYLLEQRTWSLVWHDTGGHPLPRALSWSRFWGAPPAGTMIRHLHGGEKWD